MKEGLESSGQVRGLGFGVWGLGFGVWGFGIICASSNQQSHLTILPHAAWTEISSNFGASFNPKPEVIPYSRRDFNSCVDRGVDMLRQACGDQDLRAQCFVVAIGDAKDEELYRYFKNTMYSNGNAFALLLVTHPHHAS